MKNYIQEGNVITLPVTASAVSGAWELVGDIAAVLAVDADSDDNAECAVTGVFDMEVSAADASAGAAISIGDKIYADGTDLNVDATNGVFFGHALEAVASGETTTIAVRLKG